VALPAREGRRAGGELAGDRANAGLGKIQVSIPPPLYFAPQDTFIGTQKYAQAFHLDAAIAFAGFNAAVRIDISTGKGVAVDAQMDKITILDENRFSIAAAEGGGGPKISLATFQQPNHAVARFRPPHFYITGRLGFLGVKLALYASVTAQGIDFTLDGQLVSGVSFDLDVRFGKAGLGAAGSLKVGVGTVDLGALGKAKVNTTLDVAADLDLDGMPRTVSVAEGATYAPDTTLLENELTRLVFQKDGNLVLYRGGGTQWDPLWASGTAGRYATKLVFQQDGNLVIYGSVLGREAPLWATNTAGHNVAKLALQDDCNLVLYDGAGKPWWASNTDGQMAVIAMESGFSFAGQHYDIARFRLAARSDTFPQLPSILSTAIAHVPGFRWLFFPGMSSSKTPGNPSVRCAQRSYALHLCAC
jgi:hypothetical protein